MVRKERTINPEIRLEVSYDKKDFVLIEITEEEHTIINDYFVNKKFDLKCPLLQDNINYSDIHMYGKSNSPQLSDSLLKNYIDKEMLTFRWHNDRDIFVQGRIDKDNEDGKERFMTQSIKSPLEVFKAHIVKMGKPKYIAIISRPCKKVNKKHYDNAAKNRDTLFTQF